jgi:predicted MFS family arabinose efflux permease
MTENEVTSYQVYCTRWVQLLIYFLVNFTNGLPGATFPPIALETATFFSITTAQVNALTIVSSFLYVAGTILSICLNRWLSIRMGMIIGSILNLGVIIRLFALISPSTGYPALMIGQIFPAVSGPLFMNITALFAARWFAPKQRDLATAIGSIANPLGKNLNLRK